VASYGGKQDYDRIAKEYSERVRHFLDTSHVWRRESAVFYNIVAHHPFIDPRHDQSAAYSADNKAVIDPNQPSMQVVSLAPVYMQATVGMLMQYGYGFEAYSADPYTRISGDVMSDALDWATDAASYNKCVNGVITDVMVRGVGASVLELGAPTRNMPAGVPVKRRKHHVFFDRGQAEDINARDLAWCGYADPVYEDSIEAYKKRIKRDKPLATAAGGFRDQLLQYSNAEDEDKIRFLTTYFWQDTVPARIIENVFFGNEELLAAFDAVPEAFELAGEFAKKHQLPLGNYQGNTQWLLSPEAWQDFNELTKLLEEFYGIKVPEVEPYEFECAMFFRARFDCSGNMWECGQSFTQECHAMNIATAYYDRNKGVFYGPMRAAAYIQEMLNDGMANFQMLSDRSASGGNIATTGTGVDTKGVLTAIKNKAQAITLPKDATIQSYGLPDASQIQIGYINLLIEVMPMIWCGSKEMLGQMNADTPAASLFRAAQAQMRTGLSHILYMIEDYIRNDGLAFRDLIYNLAQVRDVQMLPRIAPKHGEKDYFELSVQNLTRDYGIRIVRKPNNEDERVDAFVKLMELVNTLPDELRLRAVPIVVEAATIDEQIRDKLTQAIAPQEPDPAAMEMQQAQKEQMLANTRMINAQAAQLEQQSGREESASELNRQKSAVEIAKASADIEHKQAQTIKTEADAAKVIADIGITAYNNVNSMEAV
jgi:hypothetical protein